MIDLPRAAYRIVETTIDNEPTCVAEVVVCEPGPDQYDAWPEYSDFAFAFGPPAVQLGFCKSPTLRGRMKVYLKEWMRTISIGDDPINLVLLWQDADQVVHGRLMVGCVLKEVELVMNHYETMPVTWAFDEMRELVSTAA